MSGDKEVRKCKTCNRIIFDMDVMLRHQKIAHGFEFDITRWGKYYKYMKRT